MSKQGNIIIKGARVHNLKGIDVEIPRNQLVVITGLSGLTAGAVYYLSTSGAITTVAPTPSGSLRRVVIGKAISTTALLFWPGTPITG